jgi:hypothetical protein
MNALRSLAFAALLVSVSACLPLPIAHNQLVTAPVMGVVRRSDGTPAPGLRVAVTADVREEGCRRHGASSVTDSAGRFALPAVHERHRVLWLTLMESFGMTWYWLCAGGSSPRSSLDSSAVPARTRVVGWIRGDTLSCLTWTLVDVPRVTCSGPINQRRIVTDGQWSDGNDSGTFRLLLTDAERSGYSSRAVVQWITSADSGVVGTGRVRGQLELPTGEPVLGGSFMTLDGRWRVRVESVRRTKWNKRRYLIFELGFPGEARLVGGA